MCFLMLALVCLYASSGEAWSTTSHGPARNNCGNTGTDPNNTDPVCYCYHNENFLPYNISGLFVDCSRRNLAIVPTQLPSNAAFLDMSHNNLTGEYLVSHQPFRQFSNLTVVFLAYNKICNIVNESFTGLENALILDITMIYIRYDKNSISQTAFKHLKCLRNLRMKQNWTNFNKEESYPDKAISDLKALDTLHIDTMPDRPFPSRFRELTNLKYIQLSHDCCINRCNVPRIDNNTFQNLPHLQYIGMAVCRVQQIMYNAFGVLTNLTRLDLNWNENLTFSCMYNLTSGLRYTKIDMLWLIGIHNYYGGCNTLTAEHLQFLNETNIKHLVIGSNHISGLTMNATNYIPKSLDYLSLADNMFLYDKYVTKIFNKNLLPNLEKLIISNQFESKVPGNLPPYRVSVRKWTDQDSETGFEEYPGQVLQYGLQNQQKHSSPVCVSLNTKPTAGELSNEVKDDVTYLRLPRCLETLNLSNMRMRMALAKYNLSTQPNSLRYLYMNRNMFLKWKGPITGFNKLETLDLSENGCDFVSNSFFYDMPELKYLNMSYNYLGESLSKDENGSIFYQLQKLQTMDLSNNIITRLPKKIFSGLEKLQQLIVSDNHMIEFDVEISHMKKLNFTNFTGNVLSSLPLSVRAHLDKLASTHNMTINLLNNNMQCDCTHQQFLQWMLDTEVRFDNISAYTCTNMDRQQQNLTRYELRKNILPQLRRQCYDYTWLYIAVTAVVTLIVGSITGSVVYRNRYRIYYLYYKCKFSIKYSHSRQGYERLSDKKDINVSYADTDAEWKFFDEIIKTELEEKRNISLYDEYLNGKLGEYVTENIIEGIIRTQGTLIVLTKDYLRQRCCRFILNMVREAAIERNSRIMHFVFKGITVDSLEEICPDKKFVLEIQRMISDTKYAHVVTYPENMLTGTRKWKGFWDSMTEQLRNDSTKQA